MIYSTKFFGQHPGNANNFSEHRMLELQLSKHAQALPFLRVKCVLDYTLLQVY